MVTLAVLKDSQIILVYSNLCLFLPVITNYICNFDSLMASYLPKPLLAPVNTTTAPCAM